MPPRPLCPRLNFQPIITSDHEVHVVRIFAGDEAQYWVHYNAYWLDNSRRLPDVEARLIYAPGQADPVGFIAYGQHYADKELTEAVQGICEIIHMVIDEPFQRLGFGRQATRQAIDELRQWPGCREIVIAYNPANQPARHLYEALGFKEYGRNYDGDPLLRLSNQR